MLCPGGVRDGIIAGRRVRESLGVLFAARSEGRRVSTCDAESLGLTVAFRSDLADDLRDDGVKANGVGDGRTSRGCLADCMTSLLRMPLLADVLARLVGLSRFSRCVREPRRELA